MLVMLKGLSWHPYRLKDVANQWYNEGEDLRGINVEPSVWGEFVKDFLDHFFPQELREEKVQEFVNLKQGKMTIKEYALKFT